MFRRAALVLASCALAAVAQDADRPLLNGLSLNAYHVRVEAGDSLATTVVEETFYNANAGIAEADFLFPLPAGTAASGLQLEMGGKYYGGNLLRSERARRIYGEITRRTRDPALLDCVGKDLFRCRVFPVPAHGTASIRLAYRQPLLAEGAMRRLVVPLDAARFNRAPVPEFSLEIHLKTEKGLQAIVCPSHDVKVHRKSAHEAYVTLEARQAYLARDLVLLYAVDDAPMGAVLSTYRRAGRGYFVLSIDAAFAREGQEKAPRDLVLAVDTSNSAAGGGLDAATAAAVLAVEGLKPRDRFALVSFSTEPRVLVGFTHPAEGSADRVRTLLAGHPVAGRTNLEAAIRGASAVAGKGHPGAGIILRPDGQESEGSAIAGAAEETAAAGHRGGWCGVGAGVDARTLDDLGAKGRGDSAYAADSNGLRESVAHLLESTRAVPLTDVEVEIEGVSDLHPQVLRMVHPGDTILVAGRYSRSGPTGVTIRGRVAGAPVTRTLTLDLRARGGDPAVARLWAARRIGALLEEARHEGDPSLHAAEIGRLGRQYGIVTPHTSLLVLEEDDQERYLKGMRRQSLLRSEGGRMEDRRVVTREATAGLSERIRALARCKSGDVNPFEDLLGANRLRVRTVGDRTFYRGDDGTWVEADLVGNEPAEPRRVAFLSEAWQELAADEEIARVLALGDAVLFTGPDGAVVRVTE